MRARFAIVVILLGAAAAAVPAQQQAPDQAPPVFRSQVDAVEIDAFVTDASGNPVLDLTIDDFELLEDGRPQTISAFTRVDIPLEKDPRPLYSPIEIEPDAYANTRGEGRVYVIALDEVRADLALRTRHFLRRFIEQNLAANDIAAVVSVGRARRADSQDFTSSRRRLLAAIDKFSGGFTAEPLTPALGETPPPSSANAEAEFLARARVRALRDLTEFLATIRGRRKSVIYITETLGDVFGVLDYNGGARSIAFDDLHAAITAATRGNVSIYPIDPRGLSPDGGTGDTEAAPEAAGPAGLARVQELRALAAATGGFALANSNDYQGAFERIVRENSAYYVLGFTSTNERRDGRFRRLEVRVKRPGLVVRTRSGYLAPMRNPPAAPAPGNAAKLPLSLVEAIGTPLPATAVPMRVVAAPFKGSDRDALVAVAAELGAASLGFAQRDGVFVSDVVVGMNAIDARGTVHPGQWHQARITLRPERFARMRESEGVRMIGEMRLPPGRYQLRVAGGPADGSAGSVIADLDVPDFTRERFVMSGVALTTRATAGAPLITASNPLADLLPGPLVATREFGRDDVLALYTEVYESGRLPAHTIAFTAQLRTDDGRVMFTADEERSSKEIGDRPGGYGFRVEMPLADAAPGLYVIHVEARATIRDLPTLTRDVPIRVR